MLLPDWLGAAIAIPAALILIAICVGCALRMSLREARSQRSALIACIATLMLIVGVDHFFSLRDVPILGFGVELAGFAVGCLVLYSLVAAITFLFRQRYRVVGIQMLVVSVLTLWWVVLAEPSGAG
ncbi:MAG: hypothetical protein ACIAXF_16785 [Phycisphaerales bacterium JB063]